MIKVKPNIAEKSYVTSSRAAQLTGYSQDYIGQLCRNGNIICSRVSGEWQVVLTSVLAYKKRFNPEFDVSSGVSKGTINEQDVLNRSTDGHRDVVSKDGKEYLSSADAAQLTGYSQDYIGQLARSSSILATKVGRKWFVEEYSLLKHKDHNDGLLAAVQSKSVGISTDSKPIKIINAEAIHKIPLVTYKTEGDLEIPSTDNVLDAITVKPKVHNKISRYTAGNIDKTGTTLMQEHVKGLAKNHKSVESISINNTKVSSANRALAKAIIAVSVALIALSVIMPERINSYTNQMLGNNNSNILGSNIILDNVYKLASTEVVYIKR